MFNNIIKALKGILDANDLVQVVYLYERSDATGTPFATITPSANEGAYSSTSENRRVYAFLLRLFVERVGQGNEDNADTAMRGLIDSVLNDLDKNWKMSTVENAAGQTFLFMEAAPSSWGYIGREMQYRVAEINIRCHVNVDVNIIS